jgi:hypothetical protein
VQRARPADDLNRRPFQPLAHEYEHVLPVYSFVYECTGESIDLEANPVKVAQGFTATRRINFSVSGHRHHLYGLARLK